MKMFYEVRISDAKGKLKNKISGLELSKAFWKKIYEEDDKSSIGSKKMGKTSIHKKLKEMYPHLYDSPLNFNY
jgi:hypothetical protein